MRDRIIFYEINFQFDVKLQSRSVLLVCVWKMHEKLYQMMFT
jgi:hypothetical protein